MQFISHLKSLFNLNVKALSHIFVIGGFQVAAFIKLTREYFKLWLERDDEIFKACEDADSLALSTTNTSGTSTHKTFKKKGGKKYPDSYKFLSGRFGSIVF